MTEERLRRSWLFVPGNRKRMVARAVECSADVLIFDLEDSVPPGEKQEALHLIAETLAAPSTGSSEWFVRISSASDLEALMQPRLSGIVLPKAEASAIAEVDRVLGDLERARPTQSAPIPLVALIESPRAVLEARAIAEASDRVAALAFGAEDFRSSMGVPSGPSGAEDHARALLGLAAHAAGVSAVDQVWTDLDDDEGLLRDTRIGRGLGYAGKFAIHPRQVDVIHEALRPTDEEVERAQEILRAFESATKDGLGAVAVRGRMVDEPVAARARTVLRLRDATDRKASSEE